MVLNKLISSLCDFKTYLIYLPINQLPILDNNNIILLINKKSFIFKFNKLKYLIILCSS